MDNSVFYFYNCCFDPIKLISSNVVQNLIATEGYVTNAFGTKIPIVVDPNILENKANTIENPPIPSNWHADIAEFGAVLRAIDLDQHQEFVMCELGCAWGCWMNISGVVAKRKGHDVLLIGVEGDDLFLNLAESTLANNGITKDEYRLFKGVASGKPGKALFPKIDQNHRAWGAEPIFNVTDDEIYNFPDYNKYDALEQFTPDAIFSDIDRVDLLHIDIQGGERSLVPNSISTLNRKVAYLCIGTHSRQIEGELFDCLIDNGWQLEIERPAILQLNQKPSVVVDGVQGWRNPRLLVKEVLDMRGSIKLVDSSKEFHMKKSEANDFEVVINNQSNFDWNTDANYPVNISYHWFKQNGQIEIFDGQRTPFEAKVLKSRCTASQKITIVAPNATGIYKLKILLVQEGITWFDKDTFKAYETDFLIE